MTFTVPVFWVSWHDDILARGYSDQGLLEAVLARQVWTPPEPIRFEHVEVRGDFPHVDGAVVILPARHHTGGEDVDRFLAELDRLGWSLVVLSGDEAWEFPWQQVVETDRRRVWTMQPIPPHVKVSGMIPGGWYPGTHEAMAEHRKAYDGRPLDWMFAGQNTHERRNQCVDVLRHLHETDPDRSHLTETDGYLRGMPQAHYWWLMAGAKVVPSPSGPCSVDTARTFEALEAGCVPVVDLVKPKDPQFDYWSTCFRDPDYPFPGVYSWEQLPAVLADVLERWPTLANRCFAWWQAWKRRIALQLDSDIRAVAGRPVEWT